jgi:hypothetical protein
VEKQIRQLGLVCVCLCARCKTKEREGRGGGGSFVFVGRAQSSDRAQVWRLFKSLNCISPPLLFISIYITSIEREREK